VREPWHNGVEAFNKHWRQKFLTRTPMSSAAELRQESVIFEQRHNSHYRYSKARRKDASGGTGHIERPLAVSANPTSTAGAAAQALHGALSPAPLHSQH
jgi:hypothetical protein